MTDNLWEYCNDCNECFKTVINGVSPVYFNKKCSKCGKLGWFDTGEDLETQ